LIGLILHCSQYSGDNNRIESDNYQKQYYQNTYEAAVVSYMSQFRFPF
jgi:hypothetical protein